MALSGLAAVFPAAAQGPGGEAPPPQVTVEEMAPEDVSVTYEYAGRVAASREVQVRARVGGILLSREFEEGSTVAEGDPLFRIDPASYEADVQRAIAQVQEAQAQLDQAERSEGRASQLARQGASSQANLDDASSQRELAQAQLAASRAALRSARLSLDYATVVAPVGGVTSLEQVPEGSLLSTGDLLTRITQLDPIYVNFSAADREAASIRDLIENGTLSSDSGTTAEDLKVRILFGGGEVYGESGRIDFTSTSIDSGTGTILSRAVLPNPDRELLPGQFVRLQVEGLRIRNAITIPTAALMQGPQGTFVYVVDDGNVAAVRPVEVGRTLEDRMVIASGLEAGDRVITRGVIKVRPGSPVEPVDASQMSEPENTEGDAGQDGEKQGDGAPAAEEAPTAQNDAPGDNAVEPADPMQADPQESTSPSEEADGPNEPDGSGENDQRASDPRAEADSSPDERRSAREPAGTPAATRVAARTDTPPVPSTALPDGEAARRATSGGGDRAETAR